MQKGILVKLTVKVVCGICVLQIFAAVPRWLFEMNCAPQFKVISFLGGLISLHFICVAKM